MKPFIHLEDIEHALKFINKVKNIIKIILIIAAVFIIFKLINKG